MKNFVLLIRSFFVFQLLTGCGGSSEQHHNETAASSSSNPPFYSVDHPQYPSPITAEHADIELLFIGNSHSSQNTLPLLVAEMITIGTGQSTYAYRDTSAMFLDERRFDGPTKDLIELREWTYVILQGQKYSTTGRYYYPTAATEHWLRVIKQQNTHPLLFPEHPRQGNNEEGQRVHNLHVEISQREATCIAPVGLAWDLSRQRYPEITLHSDGNHANLNGSLLTAYVFYQSMTGQVANQLPNIESLAVSADIQTKLKEVASETVLEHPPCLNYP